MLGAPFGGKMRGGHDGLESKALSLDHAAERHRWRWDLFAVMTTVASVTGCLIC